MQINFYFHAYFAAMSLKRTSPIIQHHRPVKMHHFDDTIAPSDGTLGQSAGMELMSPEINSLTSDERNHHLRHRNDDGEYISRKFT